MKKYLGYEIIYDPLSERLIMVKGFRRVGF
jgi:hypothetical protein